MRRYTQTQEKHVQSKSRGKKTNNAHQDNTLEALVEGKNQEHDQLPIKRYTQG